MRAKPPTGSDNRLQRPTAFAQSRDVVVIHGQFEKSPFDRECMVGLRGLEPGTGLHTSPHVPIGERTGLRSQTERQCRGQLRAAWPWLDRAPLALPPLRGFGGD